MKARIQYVMPALATLLLSCLASGQEPAASYPSKPVTIIVPATAGASFDRNARLYARELGDRLRQPFVVDFKPGAGGTIAAAFVAKAAPDGHVITLISPSFTIAPLLYKDLPYDPVKSFAPISLASSAPYIFVVHPSVPARTLSEYIALARANPGKINIGTTGVGAFNHLLAAWLHIATGTKATFVPYKGGPLYMADLLAGRIDGGISSIPFVTPYVTAGKLRAIGVTSARRNPVVPDLPTFAEQGVPGYDAVNWLGFLAPAKTPGPIVAKLSAEFAKALKQSDVMGMLKVDGAQPVGSTPEQFSQFLVAEMARWRKLVQDGNVLKRD
ncbi:MAG: hypothetical protein A3G24_17260 [Betaproteobacteria bacterium RIFCSPLOWO2_12_FULL_62_13]|nr:MAG: hypothetical protein A3G24_17260 [Betaproteobacteria bacterium RIFCSPLOWO2_12_FULL_62_13]